MRRYQYLLTPTNSMQTVLPDWYNMSYRRSGAYKGMGTVRFPGTGIGDLGDDALPLCSTITLPAGFVGPVNCDPSQGGPSYPASQSQLFGVLNDLQAQLDTLGASIGTPTSTIPAWLPWALGGLAVLVLIGGRRR